MKQNNDRVVKISSSFDSSTAKAAEKLSSQNFKQKVSTDVKLIKEHKIKKN